ncbi:MAG: methyltransferase domain-containing protein [Aliidiomarina sp.]|uniref:methyltransferase domain-containing protein n=1 Tax=Aliidiomarina sp. TaxID=1872439 RepID=UPI0025C211EA|nr:methyltransferase domain-containing protein [Aliidiomarina sp.]MCH8500359.1 methyltransferase domain-containing protein [Aliidiomarina sp.]
MKLPNKNEQVNRDRAFNDDVSRFQQNIYATAKGRIRQAVLQADLGFLFDKPALTVLDVGAGIGQVNSEFARVGHRVVHTDISAEMVASAEAFHRQQGLSEQYEYYACALQALSQPLGDQQFDVVLCHAVFEWLEDPMAALPALIDRVKPGGWLSLMFYNEHAQRMANMVYGNFAYVQAGLKVKKKVRFSPNSPLTPDYVLSRLQQYPLTLYRHSGVRCFHDYLREPTHQAIYQERREATQLATTAQNLQNSPELIALELKYRHTEPYRQLGRYQHVLLRRTD